MRRPSGLLARFRVAILGLILLSAALLYGCATPTVQISTMAAATPTAGALPTATAVAGVAGTPTATLAPVTATAEQLARLGCVCHFQGEQGAPPVSQVAVLPADTIRQTVRQGRGTMPAWNSQNLNDQWLAQIVAFLQSAQQGTPTPAMP